MRLVGLGLRFFSGRAHWFKSTTEPLSKPPGFNYKPKAEPAGFEPFSAADSQRLEKAYLAHDDVCLIEQDRLYEVNVPKRQYTSAYWPGQVYAVRRGTWFYKSNTKLLPISENLAEELEKGYQAGDKTFKLSNGKGVNLIDAKETVTGTITTDNWMGVLKNLGSSTAIVRGFPLDEEKKLADFKLAKDGPADMPPFAEQLSRPIKHLLFCVHGIGQQLGFRYEFVNFVNDANDMRKTLRTTFAKSPDLQKAAGSTWNNGIQVLPILWRQKHDPKSAHLHQDVSRFSIHDLLAKDNLLAEAVLDFIMYTQADHRKAILDVTVDELNARYEQFCKHNPECNNLKVSIAAHSLGSVMINEILRGEKRLKFDVDNVFFLGSPMGTLQYVQGAPYKLEGLQAKSLYNVFRPSDPVGSRLEPLVDAKAVSVAPYPIPDDSNILTQVREFSEELNAMGTRISRGATTMWTSIARQLTQAKPRPSEALAPTNNKTGRDVSIKLEEFNRYGRLDFSVPESVDLSLVLALAGHMMYFDNPSVAKFIMRELYGAPKL